MQMLLCILCKNALPVFVQKNSIVLSKSKQQLVLSQTDKHVEGLYIVFQSKKGDTTACLLTKTIFIQPTFLNMGS